MITTNGVLAGIRVLDLGRMMAGPYCGKLLAMMGAEVIKIENEARFDTTRILPPVVEGHAGKNGSVSYNTLNTDKQSLLIDLSHPTGKELFLDLVRLSDVVLENFSPRVMPKLGLHYEALRAVRPDIILASLSGFGATGPEKDYMSYATVIEGLSGITALNTFADGDPWGGGPPFPDYFMGATASLAIAAALTHRDRTGEGQHVDVSQLQSAVMLFPEAVLDFELNGRVAVPMGNVRQGSAPAGVYQCAGEDRWIALDVTTDEEWKGLCQALGEPSLAADRRFATAAARKQNIGEIEGWLAEKASSRDAEELFHALQRRGVKAAISTSVKDLLDDPHMQVRGLLTEVDHPLSGRGISVHAPWRLEETPSRIEKAAARLGEHTRPILRELLGLCETRVGELEYERVVV